MNWDKFVEDLDATELDALHLSICRLRTQRAKEATKGIQLNSIEWAFVCKGQNVEAIRHLRNRLRDTKTPLSIAEAKAVVDRAVEEAKR